MRILPVISGTGATYQTVQQMKQLISEASIDPIIRKQAYLATAHCDKYDTACKAYSVLGYAKSKMDYAFDPYRFELLQHPKLIAKAIDLGRRVYGDCDDFSMYIASLAKAIGLKPKLRIISMDGRRYHHVYVIVNGITLDGTTDAINLKYVKAFDVQV